MVLRAREETSRRHEIEMRESEALKAAVMEAALDSIITLDRHGRRVGAQSHRGTDLRLVDGGRSWDKSFSRLLLAGSARANFYALLREGRRAQRQGRQPQTRRSPLARRADGRLMPLEVSVVPWNWATSFSYPVPARHHPAQGTGPGDPKSRRLCQREPHPHAARQPRRAPAV